MSMAKRANEARREGRPMADYNRWFEIVDTWVPGPSGDDEGVNEVPAPATEGSVGTTTEGV